MVNHNNITMRRKERQITNPEFIERILELCPVCTLSLHDEPYPYEVPLNFGFSKNGNDFIIYLHMSTEGYKMELLKKNSKVACNMCSFVNRASGEKYHGELQDYRSVTVFGEAEIITCQQTDEFLTGLNALQEHYKRVPLKRAPITDKLVVVKIKAEAVTAKAMYPITDISEVDMPQ